MPTNKEEPRQRVYLIRLACGDGVRKPLSQEAFAELVNRRNPGARYDSGMISRIETGDRKLSLDDIHAFAAVDPLKRHPAWIPFGIDAPMEPREGGRTWVAKQAAKKPSRRDKNA